MAYTILGGSGDGTDWRFDERTYGGSNGNSNVLYDRWRLHYATDYVSDGSAWSAVGNQGPAGWKNNNSPWDDFTIGSTRTVNNKRGISWVSVVEHDSCSLDAGEYSASDCDWSNWRTIQENTVFN